MRYVFLPACVCGPGKLPLTAPQLDNCSMVSVTMKVFSLLSGRMIMSTLPGLLHTMSVAMAKFDETPAIKCIHPQ